MTITKALYFDMDGTLADFYGVPNWLDCLMNGDSFPYEVAKPLLNFSALARKLHTLQREGWTIGIISWLAKNNTSDFDTRVTIAKENWLKKHLPSVTFDEIHIVPYGTPKSSICKIKNGILFDDETHNLIEWQRSGGVAFTPECILYALTALRKAV